jgi:hypothetical protein
MDAVEWLELQAMKSGRREKDPALVGALLASRQARLQAATEPPVRLRLLRALVADFTGLHDVPAFQRAADALAGEPQVKAALARERTDLDTEARMLNEGLEQEARLRDPASRSAALARLHAMFENLVAQRVW